MTHYIPVELIADILSYAQYEDCLPSYKWLRRYALVCKEWCPYAQALLFHRVVLLSGGKQCERFVVALSGKLSKDFEHTLFLRRSVRALSLGMDHQGTYVDAILLCPNLFELDVRLFHAMFRAESLQKLRRAPKYEALAIRSTFYTPMHQLLEASPAVKYLSLNVVSVRIVSQHISLACQLRELRIFCLPSDTSDIISWILPTKESRAALEVLHVKEASTSQISRATLSDFQGLRSLHVKSMAPSELLPLRHLEELALRGVAPSADHIEAFPHSLRHILIPSITRGTQEVLQGLRSYQKASNGALVTLTYTRSSTYGSTIEEDDVRAVQSFCQSHNIEFRLMDPPYGAIRGEVSYGLFHPFSLT